LSSLSPGVNTTCIRVLRQCLCMIRSSTGIPHWCPFFVCPLARLHPTACGRLSRVVRVSVADTISR
jgi:hypothetical protein